MFLNFSPKYWCFFRLMALLQPATMTVNRVCFAMIFFVFFFRTLKISGSNLIFFAI